jgi:Flp pilus assembly protein TadG
MKTAPMSRIGFRTLRSALDMFRDRRGVAAIEFAIIVPIMLVMFFGVVEFSSGVAVDRKVTLVARTLSDLTSQAPSAAPQAQYAAVTDSYMQNVFSASIAILQPYSAMSITNATVSEIYVDVNSKATIQWSEAATILSDTATQATLAASTHTPNQDVTTQVPPTLLTPHTYLIWSEVKYLYKPTIGYVMGKAGVTLNDVAFTRPRQVVCLTYPTNSALPTLVVSSGNPTCPLTP